MLNPSLVEELLAFRRARDWEQFHNLRTLSTSLTLECTELLELTQWAGDKDLARIAQVETDAIQDEIADIAGWHAGRGCEGRTAVHADV